MNGNQPKADKTRKRSCERQPKKLEKQHYRGCHFQVSLK
ncbi:hypothetical protein BROSI_A2292 [Candidatus Brocadia sinica JPN1]|uniref:Uncharacterized protein n=1 Tax=Candidatus Brocadia sinica JPN1 TaxID=1197129 RepID=A0ABQ0JY90_9BACT|nr:hypothetical protein BROSI_A2292 [Candidatus Brocadia sinica JPN1]